MTLNFNIFAGRSFTLLCVFFLTSMPLAAQTLQVYTKPIEPFAFQQNGKAAGFSIELWDRIAKEANLTYELHWVETVREVIQKLESKEADIGIAAISITSDREKIVDFSTPFYESGLSILVNAQSGSSTTAILDSVLSIDTLKIIGVLSAILLVCSHFVWFFERKRNPEQFPEPYFEGVWESTWWAISTILSGGCDAKGPVALGGRIVGAFWMLICIIAITYFTAVITTIMTVNQLTSDINGPGDLPGKPVATIKGTTAETYLQNNRAKVVSFDKIEDAYKAIAQNQVKAVVYDAPILLYHANSAKNTQERVVGPLFQRQNYGVAMQPNSPYRKQINAAILKLREEGYIDELQKKWFGVNE